MNSIIHNAIHTHLAIVEKLAKEDSQPILQALGNAAIETLQSGGKVIFMGNGGSAADSQHLAAELVGRFETERRGLAAIALTTDSSIVTAVGNDYGFDFIFSRQIEALAKKNDLVVGLSTSGESQNVINGIKTAKEIGCVTAGLLGNNGGRLKSLVKFPLLVPSDNTARIQECHILIGHILCELIEQTVVNATT